jgi:hypothetical protein
MKIEELFIGAVVRYLVTNYPVCGINEQDQVLIGGSWIHYSNIEPVPIKPEILLRLEGENGERFELVNGFYFINGGIRVWCEEDKMGVDWFYKNPFNGCFFGIGNINDVISRVRLDAGIFLTLKPE